MSINVRLKHKRDTAANWTSKNPVLLDGEIVLVDDDGTLRIKMGDGVTSFTLLPYYDAPMTAHIANTSNPHKVTKAQVGLGNVDNTADANKSVNYATSAGHAITADGLTDVTAIAAELNVLDGITASTAELNLLDGVTATTAEINYLEGVTSAIQSQLNAKAALASPAFTGTPTAPTATAGTNTTQVATTAFVTTAVANKTSVTSATKATQDGSGNVITDTYLTKTDASNTYLGKTAKAASATVADSANAVAWDNVSGKPTSFAPASHNQASNTINAMTGYSKASSAAAIATTDSLNTAIGKLEKGLDGKLSTSGTAAKATADANGNNIVSTYATKSEISNISASATKVTFTASDSKWGSLSNGNYPLTIPASGKYCFGVYETNGSNYDKVEVGVTNSGTNVIIYAPAKFAGYALFI